MPRTKLLLDHSRIVGPIRTSVYTSRQPKVGELEVAVLVYQDIIRFDIPTRISQSMPGEERNDTPVDKAEIVHGFNGERALGHVKPGHVFGENVILH